MIDVCQLEQLWQMHAAALELMARSRCAAPEDCVQEAFIRLARQQPVPTQPAAWLWRVVRNLSLNQQRAWRRKQHHEQQAAAVRSQALVSSGTSPLDDQLDAATVTAALASLDDDLRDVVVASLWGGLTFREIGEAFEISHAAAHRRYQQAIEQLRKQLEPVRKT